MMKKIYRILAMLCTTFTLVTCSGCHFDFGGLLNSEASTSGAESSFSSKSDDSSSSDTSSDISWDSSDTDEDESYKNDPDYVRYSYTPVITETMPRIQINTPDGDSSFATKYGMQDKIEDARTNSYSKTRRRKSRCAATRRSITKKSPFV